MSNDTTQDFGAAVPPSNAGAPNDRIFLADGDAIEGPFSSDSLPSEDAARPQWIWQPGDAAWRLRTPVANVIGGDSPAKARIDELLSSIEQRGKAIRAAATLELRARQAHRDEAAAAQLIAASLREHGRLAIEQAMVFDDAELTRIGQAGSECVRRIEQIDAHLAEQQSDLDHLDPKSPAADRLRDQMAELNRDRRATVAELLRRESELGIKVQPLAASDTRFAGLRPQYEEAVRDRDAANAELTSIATQLAKVNDQIGLPFRKLLMIVVAAVIVLLLVVFVLRNWSGRAPVVDPTVGPGPLSAAIPPPAALARGDLPLASQMVRTHWLAWRPGLSSFLSWQATPDAEFGMSGSSGVIYASQDGTLVLITNRHVLCLAQLAEAQVNGGAAIKSYDVTVKFPTGKVRPVLGIGHDKADIDLVYLYVDGRDLRSGVDYVQLPMLPNGGTPRVGDPVVAIGNPGVPDKDTGQVTI